MNDKLMQLLIFAICVAGYVPLAILGTPTAEYVTLIGPVLAVVILQGRLGKQDEVLDEQSGKLDTISHQTNGVLTERINTAVADGVKAALTEREGTGTQ
jgi:hypothetical protein